MMLSSDLFKQIVVMRKDGRIDQALGLLRDALSRGGIGPEEIDLAGSFIKKALRDAPPAKETLRVQLLGQCTVTWIVPALTAVAWRHAQACLVAEGGYDNVLQDLDRLEAERRAPDVVVLIPWTQRLLGASGSVDERIENESKFCRHCWQTAGRIGSRILQLGYDWVSPGAEGYGLASDAETR